EEISASIRPQISILYHIASNRDPRDPNGDADGSAFDLAEKHPQIRDTVKRIEDFGKTHHPTLFLAPLDLEYTNLSEMSQHQDVSGCSSLMAEEVTNVWNGIRGNIEGEHVLVKTGNAFASKDTESPSRINANDSNIQRLVDKHIQDITMLEEMASRIFDSSSIAFNNERVSRKFNEGTHIQVESRGLDAENQPQVSFKLDLSQEGMDLSSPLRESRQSNRMVAADSRSFSESVAGLPTNDRWSQTGGVFPSSFNDEDAKRRKSRRKFRNSVDSSERVQSQKRRLSSCSPTRIGIKSTSPNRSPGRGKISENSSPLLSGRVSDEDDSILGQILDPATPKSQGEMKLDEIMIEDDSNPGKVNLTHLFKTVQSAHNADVYGAIEEEVFLGDNDVQKGAENIAWKETKSYMHENSLCIDTDEEKSRKVAQSEEMKPTKLKFSALDSYIATSSLSKSGTHPFVRTKLRATIDAILGQLEFSEKNGSSFDYRKYLEPIERFSLSSGGFIVRKVLHPLLKAVFKLDSNLLLSYCGNRIWDNEFGRDAPSSTREAKHRWTVGLVAIHKRLIPLSEIFFELEMELKQPLSLAQGLVLLRDQIEIQRALYNLGWKPSFPTMPSKSGG
ncbi:MAG: hypothetical protein SGCHY_001650, partial [Lobulomycetales sp.]